MKKIIENNNPNKAFWCFIYLIINYPEKYLSNDAEIFYMLANNKNEQLIYLTKAMKKLNMNRRKFDKLNKKLRQEKILSYILGKANKRYLCFSDEIQQRGMELFLSISKREEE